MKIKKLGHCCFVVEVAGKRVLTDPGSYSTLQNTETNIDLVVITHEHPDHLHIDSVRELLKNNPNIKIITNTSVGKLLAEAGINFEILEDGNSGEYGDVYLEAHGKLHTEIYQEFGMVENTGYFIGHDLFYPGDSFTNPNKPIDVLALPVAGPWMKIKDAINYALELKPRISFAVHDGMIEIDKPGPIYRLPENVLPKNGILFKKLELGEEQEL